jgi:hypothetical protein
MKPSKWPSLWSTHLISSTDAAAPDLAIWKARSTAVRFRCIMKTTTARLGGSGGSAGRYHAGSEGLRKLSLRLSYRGKEMIMRGNKRRLLHAGKLSPGFWRGLIGRPHRHSSRHCNNS